MSRESTILSDEDHGICTIVLDRASKANALSAALVEELIEHVDSASTRGARVLAFRAIGKTFCAGFDFTDYESFSEGDLLRRFVRIEQLLQVVRGAPFLTVACVQGTAFGAGADLAAACAIRAGGASARFRFPGFQFGVALGTRHLAGIVGSARAREILLRGEILDVHRAMDCGLLTNRVESDGFETFVRELAVATSHFAGAPLAQLLANTGQNERDRDLAELVRSLVVPGLHERIRRYRSAVTT